VEVLEEGGSKLRMIKQFGSIDSWLQIGVIFVATCCSTSNK